MKRGLALRNIAITACFKIPACAGMTDLYEVFGVRIGSSIAADASSLSVGFLQSCRSAELARLLEPANSGQSNVDVKKRPVTGNTSKLVSTCVGE